MKKSTLEIPVTTSKSDQDCIVTIQQQKKLNKNTHQIRTNDQTTEQTEMDVLLLLTKFSDIHSGLKNKKSKEKGDVFELLTKFIFLVHPNYCHKTKNIWLYDNIPLKIKQKYKLPDKDKGIDLFLETTNSEFYAIQCKYRADQFSKINWDCLATFTGQLFVGDIKKAIFVTNTYDIDEEISKCDKIECLYGDFFNDENLNEQFFDNIKKHSLNKPIVYKTKKLFSYQEEAVNSTIDHFGTKNRGYLSMACGTGKTLTTQAIDKNMKNKKTLILVPSLCLLSQIYKEWSTEYFSDSTIKYLLIGSGMDTNIAKPPFLTTKSDEIKKQLKCKNKIICISTYQSCDMLENTKFDLIIFDEAHRTVGNNSYSYALFDKNIVGTKRLFVTATPKIYTKIDDNFNYSNDSFDESELSSKSDGSELSSKSDGSELSGKSDLSNVDSEESDDGIVSMNNEKIYGKCIYTYQIGEAIENGYLTGYEIHMMVINDEQLKKFIDKKITLHNKQTINFHFVATAMMLKEMFENNDINHLLTYHSGIKNSKDFSKLLNDICDVKYIEHIDGSMSFKNKGKLIKGFTENTTAILTSAKVLNEGVNIPIVDSVCFVESRSSNIDIIQCIGRALRLYNDKIISKIIIPVLEEDINNGKFKMLAKITKNLSSYDFNIKEIITFKKNDNLKKLIKIGYYKDDIGHENIHENIDLAILNGKILNSMTNNCYKWNYMLEKVSQYINENNKRPSSTDKNSNIKRLSAWIHTQKQNYVKNEDIMKRSDIRDTWDKFIEKYKNYFLPNDELWMNNLNDVGKYIDENNKRPSRRNKNISIKQLGVWSSVQQNNYAKKIHIMKNENIRKLWDEFVKKYQKYFLSNKEQWINTLNELISYIDVNNKRPSSHDKNVKHLGKWFFEQQDNYAKKSYIMENNDISEKWQDFTQKYKNYFITGEQQWINKLKEVCKYMDDNNKRPSSTDKNIHIHQLGVWINTQNSNYAQNKNTMKNNDVNKKWEEFIQKYQNYFLSNDELWINKLNEIKKYIEEHNEVPLERSKNIEVKQMGAWIHTQQSAYTKINRCMKNPITRSKWEDFITEHQQYFPNNPAIQKQQLDVTKPVQITQEIEKKPAKVTKKTSAKPTQQTDCQELITKMQQQNSADTFKIFQKKPDLWHQYHDNQGIILKEYNKSDIPVNKIITYLKTKENYKLTIMDMGCGKNLIAQHFANNNKFTIIGYDYISYNGSKQADISKLSDDNESMKMCIYSQSLIGSNWKDYLTEGNRILEYSGEMIISDTIDKYDEVKKHINKLKMKITKDDYDKPKYWFYLHAIKQ